MSRKKLTLTGLLLVFILILILLPTLIKNYVVNNSKELFGRQISIEKIKYNYFTSTAKIYDFKMFEQNQTDVFTSFDTLIVNLEPYKLINGTKSLESIYLKGLIIHTVMKDSTFNFDDLITFYTLQSDTTNQPEKAFKYDISNIELKDAEFFFENKNVNHITHIDDFSFFIPYIGWDQEHKSNADIKFNFKNGGYFESILNIDPVSGAFDTEIIINNLKLEPFYNYFKEYADINTLNGLLNSKITVVGNSNEAINSIISGHIDIRDFVLTDLNNKEILTSKKIDCNLQKIDYANSSYVIDSLKLTEPYLFFKMDSVTNNLFTLFKLDANGELVSNETQISNDSTLSTNLYYAINHFNVDNGIMDYSDNLTGSKFNYHLSNIKINSEDIKSDLNWIDIYATMLLNNRGTLDSKLGFNPNDYNNLNLDINIKDFLLSDINVYANHYTGHNILIGDFYYFSKSIINNGNIKSENLLRIENVDITNTKKGLYKLPLKFALFLLKDKNGNVNIELPVRGDLNNPEINIGKLVWTTIKNKITGIVSNPINSLANLVDVDPKEYKELNFNYNDTIPNDSQKIKLSKLLEMEKKKLGLKVTLLQYVDPELQEEAILYSQIGNQYFIETQKNHLEDSKGFDAYIKEKTENDTVSQKEATLKLIAPLDLKVLTNDYNTKLKNNLYSYLKSINPETKIEIKTAEIKAPEHKKSDNRFEIIFSLFGEDDNINKLNTDE